MGGGGGGRGEPLAVYALPDLNPYKITLLSNCQDDRTLKDTV